MAVLNKKRDIIPPDAVYIGRGGPWGNPFVIGVDGDRQTVCELYAEWMKNQIRSGQVTLNDLAPLHGRDLVCFCAPEQCHGHTLEKLAKWAYDKLNRGER